MSNLVELDERIDFSISVINTDILSEGSHKRRCSILDIRRVLIDCKAALSEQEAVGYVSKGHLLNFEAGILDSITLFKQREVITSPVPVFTHPQPQKFDSCEDVYKTHYYNIKVPQ